MLLKSFKNRRRGAASQDGQRGLSSWLTSAFSVGYNLFTEQTCAKPNYAEFQRLAVGGVDDAPTATEPTSDVWDLDGYWSIHGYTVQTGSGSVDLQLWGRDTENEDWFLIQTLATVADQAEFHFSGKVRNRTVFLRVSALNGSVTAVDVIASPE